MRLNEDPVVVRGDHIQSTFLLAIPTFGMVPIEFVSGFGRMSFPMSSYTESMIVKGMEIGVARNYVAERIKERKNRPRYLLFVGDDMIVAWNSLLLLHEEMKTGKWDVLCAVYHKKTEPPEPLIYRIGIDGPLIPGVHFNVGDVVDVDRTGLDFTLMDSSLFDKLGPPPWFKTGFKQENGCVSGHTEDTFFYDKCREAGLKVGVHTGCRVGHFNKDNEEVY